MSFAFVIPVIHPGAQTVSNYADVERMLHVTLSSICGQSRDDVYTVVVAHRLPDWHAEFEGRVSFLTVTDDERLPIRHPERHLDKAFKLALASYYAIDQLAAEQIMMMDADDFVRRQLAEEAMSGAWPVQDGDGWIITRGYNAIVNVDPSVPVMSGAYEVRAFDGLCGSCRVFKSTKLVALLEKLMPNTHRSRDLISETISTDLLDQVFLDLDPEFGNEGSLIRLMGTHRSQELWCTLKPVDKPLVAKSCGHGNHTGPRQGDIRWHRVVREVDVAELVSGMGLEGSVVGESTSRTMPGYFVILMNAFGWGTVLTKKIFQLQSHVLGRLNRKEAS